MKTGKLANTFRVDSGKHFRLKDFDPGDCGHWGSKENADKALQERIARTAELQDKLYAQDNWALLLIFQAMDAAGKDGAIKHVMSGVNPQGCDVFSFKAPTNEELDHDFLWRCHKVVPERQKLPEKLITKHIWDERFEDVNAFERYLTRNGVLIRKFFLYISKEEQ